MTRKTEFPTLYQKTATGAIACWKVWAEGARVCSAWGQIDGKEQNKDYNAKPTNVGRSNERSAQAQAKFEAEALWKKKKRLKYYETVEEAKTEVNRKPMLAQPYEKRKDKITFPVSVQPKLDGFRCYAFLRDGKVVLQSRGGKEYDVAHISGQAHNDVFRNIGRLEEGVTLDGELYIHGMSLQSIASLIKKPQDGSERLTYNVYDTTYGGEEPWHLRMKTLEQMKHRFNTSPNLEVVRTVIAHGHEDIMDYHDHFVEEGYEGAIVRTMDHVYRFGYRSPGLLKVKTFDEKEFLIVDWTKGKDDVPLWIMKNDIEDNTFDVRPRGTQRDRAEMLANAESYVGKWMTVRFIGRTDDKKPKFAVGICLRDVEEFNNPFRE